MLWNASELLLKATELGRMEGDNSGLVHDYLVPAPEGHHMKTRAQRQRDTESKAEPVPEYTDGGTPARQLWDDKSVHDPAQTASLQG